MPVSTLAAASERRVVFIDFARAAATLLMLQGHTVDALLATAARTGLAFDAWTFARGLTSSTFLFVGGFAFSVVTHRQWSNGTAGTTVRRLRRFLFYLTLGYAMHFPAGSLRTALSMPAAGWAPFLAVDVLQCIAVTLSILQLIAVATHSPRRFVAATGLLAAGIVFVTPVAWVLAPTLPIPRALLAYVTPASGSLFPLLPYTAYGALGAAMGMLYASSAAGSSARRALQTIAPAAAVLCAAALVFRATGWELTGTALSGPGRPSQFFLQAGLVCLLVTFLAGAARVMTRRFAVVEALAQESLTVYLVHVCLVYGSPWNPGLRQFYGPTLSLPAVITCVLALWTLMALLSVWWNRYKAQAPAGSVRVRRAVLAAMAVLLVV